MRTLGAIVVAVWFVLVVLAFWLRHIRAQEEWQRLDELIRPPVQRDEFKKADETLPAKAVERRAAANKKRVEAAQIDSGKPFEERIKLSFRR